MPLILKKSFGSNYKKVCCASIDTTLLESYSIVTVVSHDAYGLHVGSKFLFPTVHSHQNLGTLIKKALLGHCSTTLRDLSHNSPAEFALDFMSDTSIGGHTLHAVALDYGIPGVDGEQLFDFLLKHAASRLTFHKTDALDIGVTNIRANTVCLYTTHNPTQLAIFLKATAILHPKAVLHMYTRSGLKKHKKIPSTIPLLDKEHLILIYYFVEDLALNAPMLL